jgi:hypothetical protein
LRAHACLPMHAAVVGLLSKAATHPHTFVYAPSYLALSMQVVGPRNKAATARGSKEVAERTPISQLFGGALQSTIRSRSQSKPSVTQQPMFAVHLEAHHKSLEEAFAALTRPEHISGGWGGVFGGEGGLGWPCRGWRHTTRAWRRPLLHSHAQSRSQVDVCVLFLLVVAEWECRDDTHFGTCLHTRRTPIHSSAHPPCLLPPALSAVLQATR